MELRLDRRRRLLLSAILALLIAVSLEILLQAFYYATAGELLFRRVLPRIFVSDATRCYRLASNLARTHRTNEFSTRIYTNDRGMRTDATRTSLPYAKPDDVYRILFLGPSFTFGWGSDVEDIYPMRIAQGLEVPGKRVEVINLGTPAQGPAPQLCWLQEEGYRYHPDLVVQTSYGDDVLAVGGECPEQLECPHVVDGRLYKKRPTPRLRLVGAAKNSAIVFYGWYLYKALAPVHERAPMIGQELYRGATRNREGADALAAQYHRYVALVHDLLGEDVGIAFLQIPFSYMVHLEDVPRWAHRKDVDPGLSRARLWTRLEALRERGVRFIDTTESLIEYADDERLFYWLDIHLTPAGNRVVADAALPELQRRIDAAAKRTRGG